MEDPWKTKRNNKRKWKCWVVHIYFQHLSRLKWTTQHLDYGLVHLSTFPGRYLSRFSQAATGLPKGWDLAIPRRGGVIGYTWSTSCGWYTNIWGVLKWGECFNTWMVEFWIWGYPHFRNLLIWFRKRSTWIREWMRSCRVNWVAIFGVEITREPTMLSPTQADMNADGKIEYEAMV